MKQEELFEILEERFEAYPERHLQISWEQVASYLEGQPRILKTIQQMEASGGEPDLIYLPDAGLIFYADMSPESPSERRSICYDQEARIKRKKNPPQRSAQELAEAMGANLLTADMYQQLQKLADLDLKSSSWLLTPDSIRELGGAIFGDKRYGTTFIYHNGADSYYQARGVRFKVDLPNWS
ncbi:DUF4256 domain-containing protein [Hutsoniella sourekii]|uniref:DUF4256 domain-containing protein n=1 Tax=Hutsoniella sourekii TaxID=87650 RepID=UPI00048991D4|nr:DUF4256 domain-containing protein [Hutsoniella sourekii]